MATKLYPVPDAARELGVSRQWVYNLLKRNIIELPTPDDLREGGIDPDMISSNRKFITEDALARYKVYHKKYAKDKY